MGTEPIIVVACVATGVLAVALGSSAYVLRRADIVERRNAVETTRAFLLSSLEAAAAPRDDTKLGRRLRAAGLAVSRSRWRLGVSLGTALGGLAALIASNSPFAASAVAALVALGSEVWLRSRAAKCGLCLSEQLAQALPQMAENMRAGLTPEASIRAVAQHMEDPVREELRMLNGEVAYGLSLAEAFSAMAKRTGNEDIKLIATICSEQSERGGRLSDSFDTVASTIDSRLAQRRRIRVITSESRMSRNVMVAMPWIMLVMTGMADHTVFEFYLADPLGWMTIAAVLGLEALGVVGMTAAAKITAG